MEKPEKKEFLAEKFYESKNVLIDFFNQLRCNREAEEEFDMYTGGGFLTWTVYLEKCSEELAELITDVDAYWNASNEIFHPEKDKNVIQLAFLHLIHQEYFDSGDEIWYDKFFELFMTEDEFNRNC